MPEIGIVLVDDHPIVLEGLVQLVGAEPDFTILAACACGVDALAAVARHHPRLMLLDVRLPDRDGIHLLDQIAAVSPQTRSVIFTAALDQERRAEALSKGAQAILFKEIPPDQLIDRIRKIAVGETQPAGVCGLVHGARTDGASALVGLLSPRERVIAAHVARGARNKQIAWQLGVAEGTVKLHISRVFRKLGVGNRVELSRIFLGFG